MPRITRLTSALAGRRKTAAAVAAAAAVLAGAGSASAATLASSPSTPHVASHHAVAAAKPTAAVKAAAKTATAQRGAVAKPATPAPAAPAAKPASPAPAAPAAAPAAPAAKPASPAPAAPAAAPAAPAPAPAPAQPYQVYDSVTPSQIPAGQPIATYADGGYAVNPTNVAGKAVTWIDTNGSDPSANALDVEPGDATPTMAATWAWQKLHTDPNATAIVYTMISEWPATQAAINTLPAPMQSHVKYWIADPTGVNHVVPGSSATQWYWGTNYDISTALPGSGLN
jgi:hypothetical protein